MMAFLRYIVLSLTISLLASKGAIAGNDHLHDDHHFSILGYAAHDLSCIDRLIRLFESWMERHGKMYHSIEEKLHRFEVFRDNLDHIDETNKKNNNYWLGLNEFADMTHDEFKQKYLGLKADLPKSGKASEFSYKDVQFEALPKSVDWRKKGAVTPVKNQGSCGMYTCHINALDLVRAADSDLYT